jgi:hypothetical protein
MSAASDAGLSQSSGCGSAMQGVDRAKADLGIDRNIMNRTRSLVDAAKQSGQAPPPAQVANVTEDSLDSLEDAAGQMDSTAQDIGRQLEALKLTRQARTWGQGVTNLQSARTQFKSAMTKQGWGGKGTRIQATSGVGPQWTSSAADSVSQSATELNAIGIDGPGSGRARQTRCRRRTRFRTRCRKRWRACDRKWRGSTPTPVPSTRSRAWRRATRRRPRKGSRMASSSSRRRPTR